MSIVFFCSRYSGQSPPINCVPLHDKHLVGKFHHLTTNLYFSTYHTWLHITTDSPLIIVYKSERILRQTKLTDCSDFNTKTLRHKHFSKSIPKVKNVRCYLHGTLVGSVSRMWDLNSQQGAKVRGQLPMLPNICNLTLLSLWVVNVQTKNNCPT